MTDKNIANPERYIKNIKEKRGFSADNIVVEHRSNNPKRDYLFVNRSQCKHIPCKPSDMINMCKKLANEVKSKVKGKRILVIAFAETATAIGNVVADELKDCIKVMQTTREDVPNSRQVITFEEEHSHATTQRLLSSNLFNTDEFHNIDYILFVEDEISTGNTILNFVKAFEKVSSGKKFGVASICNWQDKENILKFKKMKIDRFYLLSGELNNVNAKMFTEDTLLMLKEQSRQIDVEGDRLERHTLSGKYQLLERLEHNPKRDLTKLFNAIEQLVGSARRVRVVGTEEFMYVPIKVAEYLERKGINTICHSTTRSSIDVTTQCGITDKHRIVSPYDPERRTYIYNTYEYTDKVIVISDALISEYMKDNMRKIFNTREILTITM